MLERLMHRQPDNLLTQSQRALAAAHTARTRRQRERARRLVADVRQAMRGPAGVQDRPADLAPSVNWSSARMQHVCDELRTAAEQLEEAN